ncbi:MAG: MBL fold metallo-hydrolase [Candidatus Hydrogenedentota bacterium]
MQIKVIAVGTKRWERWLRRWGISFLIEEDILFDTFGDAYVFLRNLRQMQVDISKIKHIILSHSHWDHISGLWHIINKHKDINVYICPNFKQEIKEKIRASGANVIEVGSFLNICGNVYSTGEIYGKQKGSDIYEQAMVIKTQKGISIVCGCAHPGILNIVNEVKRFFKENIYLIIGGLHLKESTQEQIEEVVHRLKLERIIKIAPTHCTGKIGTNLLAKEYVDNFVQVKQGCVIEI